MIVKVPPTGDATVSNLGYPTPETVRRLLLDVMFHRIDLWGQKQTWAINTVAGNLIPVAQEREGEAEPVRHTQENTAQNYFKREHNQTLERCRKEISYHQMLMRTLALVPHLIALVFRNVPYDAISHAHSTIGRSSRCRRSCAPL